MSNLVKSGVTRQKVELKAEKRAIVGRPVKSLRRDGLMPAVVYGHGFAAINLQVTANDFAKTYAQAGESTLVYLSVDGQSYPTIIHDVVRDPVSDHFQHADFYKVRLDEKIHAKIPLQFVGEAPAVKGLGGILVKNILELEVEGLPQDLPHQIEVAVANLANFKDHIAVKDLTVSDKITIKAKPEDIVVLIQEPISEEELKAQLETPVAGVEEVEVIKKEKEEAVAEEPGEASPTPAPEK